ncbi:hypothetical protein SBT04_26835, partial [Klebsiella pneumoniae]|uniref:hypothetical protein n=1 Tax=Klebsiella pneumoniae TaxID=573 RepID=UPI00298C3E13
ASQLVVKIGVAKTGVTIDSVFQADPTITAGTASVGIDGFFSDINAMKANTVFVRQMDTHQAKNKAAPPPVNLTVIVIQ